MNKILTMTGLAMLLSQTIVAQQTINEVLTVNTSGANTIRVENDVAGEEATIRFRSKPSNGSGWLHADISSYATNSNTGFLGFKVPHDNSFGTGFDLVLTHEGKLGIGTASPSSRLELEQTGSDFIDMNRTSANSSFRLAISSNGRFSIYDVISANERLSINSNGNIGIGSTNPNSKLTLQGDGTTVGSAAINFKHSGNGMSIGLGTTSNNLVIGNSWNPESGTYLTIQDGTGKVGIGTTDFSGNHKLRVEGSIGAREIKVEASGWSDFVFERDYELRTLEEVEEHITKKGHLPEIPNEVEVTENGINLGEMDAKLLQKIEELTLYIIDMNKRMNQLETENQELKEKVDRLENK